MQCTLDIECVHAILRIIYYSTHGTQIGYPKHTCIIGLHLILIASVYIGEYARDKIMGFSEAAIVGSNKGSRFPRTTLWLIIIVYILHCLSLTANVRHTLPINKIDIKRCSFLTACMFWFVFLNARSHLCFRFFVCFCPLQLQRRSPGQPLETHQSVHQQRRKPPSLYWWWDNDTRDIDAVSVRCEHLHSRLEQVNSAR